MGDEAWDKYYTSLSKQILAKQQASGGWKDTHIGEVYPTAINATILQLDNGFLPIYQR